MRFETVSGSELNDVVRSAEMKIKWIKERGGNVLDVDFLIDNKKVLPYRAVIKYEGESII